MPFDCSAAFPMRSSLFWGTVHRAHHIVLYCLKWFNKHFALRCSVIILWPSRQPMALQISPVLSTPHFILLHVGCFTARQWRWLTATGKKLCPVFPQRIIQTAEQSVRKKPVPTVSLDLHYSKRSVLSFTVGTSRSQSSCDVFCHY